MFAVVLEFACQNQVKMRNLSKVVVKPLHQELCDINICIYICIHIYINVYIYVYIHICVYRERERERDKKNEHAMPSRLEAHCKR